MGYNLTKISSCEVCDNTIIYSVLDLGEHPMCDDLIPIGDDRICKNYPIEIAFCDTCVTAHQLYQIPKQDLFPKTYHYRSRHTADVLNGMKELVDACQASTGSLKDKMVLDIGCNDGSLLSIFAERGAKTFGVEPTNAANDAIEIGEHIIINDFFTKEVAEKISAENGSPDIITFTNVFAHIEDLKSLVRALNILSGPNTIIVIENHYLGAVLDKNQFDTFYHEHPRSYSYTSFKYIAKSLRMSVSNVEFPSRYGGNIRIFISSLSDEIKNKALDDLYLKEKSYGDRLINLSDNINTWRIKKLNELEQTIKQFGPLPGKAFPGRAAIPIKLLGLDETHISAVYEKPGSDKVGNYVPGTRIPIKSDIDFSPQGIPLLNFAWHISREIRSYLKSSGFADPIIDIISEDDFD